MMVLTFQFFLFHIALLRLYIYSIQYCQHIEYQFGEDKTIFL
jgi:hypothetical protein